MTPMSYVAIVFAVIIMGMGIKISMDKSDYDDLIVSHAREIRELGSRLEAEQAKNAVSLSNEATYKGTIEYLNGLIAKGEIDLDKKNQEIANWKKLPDGKKYKELYDALSKVKDNTNDCERYEDTSNAFDGFDINKL